MADQQNLNIYQKLAKIRKQVEVIQRNKKGYGYTYVSEDEILAKISGFMDKYALSLIPSVVHNSSIVSPYSTKKTKSTNKGEIYEENVNEVLVSADMVFTWVNNENPEERVDVPWILVGHQSDGSQSFGSGLSYRWYLRYIRKLPSKEMFFSSYGSFIHKLIELYYKEGKTSKQLTDMYLSGFKENVSGRAPNPKIFTNYFKDGLR